MAWIDSTSAVEEERKTVATDAQPLASVVRGVLFMPEAVGGERSAVGAHLLDISGRKVLDLHPGANDMRALAPGVYFVCEQVQAQGHASVRKVVVTR
jgi:hypothetical protein